MNDDIRPGSPKTTLPKPEPQGGDIVEPNPVENLEHIDTTGPDSSPADINSKNKKRKHKLVNWFRQLTKKQRILLITVLVLLLSGTVFGAYKLTRKPVAVTPQPAPKVEEPPKPTTERSKLTGVMVKPELNQRPVTGIMIENSPDARPQAGLKDAGVVFEAVAEGGITRFLALFQESQPDHIGPVRSVRPYYLDWALSFDAPLAHAGGSPDALADIKSLPVKDLDQFANSAGYWRVNSRYAPHNLYTSMAKLDELKNKKGFTKSDFTGFSRKDEKVSATPTDKSIDLTISSALYNVHYDFDISTNTYKRSEGGKPHNDEKSAAQLAPKVVVAMVISKRIQSDGKHNSYSTVGSGKIFIFQDGLRSEGTWKKDDRKGQLKFVDANGNPIQLSAGQTWISMIDGPEKLVSKP